MTKIMACFTRHEGKLKAYSYTQYNSEEQIGISLALFSIPTSVVGVVGVHHDLHLALVAVVYLVF